ncbi:interferon gamma-like [Elgaria multicarinata webbii]|uniref:interferon gamma-like n=1 Tax=Elgaria multicarinata webbii TaxID=159646 RepID=UPI002FCCC222
MVWQICLFIFLATSCSDGRFLPSSILEKVAKSIEMLEKEFNTSLPDVAEGPPLFIGLLKSELWENAKEKNILFAQVISMYWKMLSNSSKTQTSDYIKDLLEALNEYNVQYNKSLQKANDIIALSKLPMHELKIKRKAAAEIYLVLREVNIEENKRKRKRRQNPQGQKAYRPHLRG